MSKVFSLSDDDFMNQDPSEFFGEPATEEPENEEELETEPEELEEEETGSDDSEEDEFTAYDGDATEDDLDEEDQEDGSEESDQEDETEEDEADEEENDTGSDELKELMAPLKHHGSDFQIKNKEEARRLMHMGLDYTRKMYEMKSQRRYLQMLNNNGLLDESKLNHIIDLTKGDVGAFRQLAKEHGIDLMDLAGDDEEDTQRYTPANHSVSESELEMDEVLESVRGTPTGNQSLQLLQSWDGDSKSMLAEKPRVIAVINEHMSNGVAKTVLDEVQRERILGNLNGVSDLDAYMQIGEKLYQSGALKDTLGAPNTPAKKPSPAKKAKEAKALQERRKRVVPPKKTRAKKASVTHDQIFELSDEEFEKLNI